METEYLSLPDQFQVPKVIDASGTKYTLQKWVGGGRIADIGLFKGTFPTYTWDATTRREVGVDAPVAVKISSTNRKGLSNEFFFTYTLVDTIKKDPGYSGALPPNPHKFLDQFIIRKNDQEVEASALFMEWIEGDRLDNIWTESKDKKPFTLQQASDISIQIGLLMQAYHKLKATDKDPQAINYFLQKGEKTRVRKVDFDLIGPLDLTSLRTEYDRYFRFIVYRLLTNKSGGPIDFKTGKLDFTEINKGDVIGRRFGRTLAEYAYIGYIQSTDVDELQKAYDNLIEAVKLPQTFAAFSTEQRDSLLAESLKALNPEDFSWQTALTTACLLDMAEEKGDTPKLDEDGQKKLEWFESKLKETTGEAPSPEVKKQEPVDIFTALQKRTADLEQELAVKTEENKQLTGQVEESQPQIEKLQAEIKRLQDENAKFQGENLKLRVEVTKWKEKKKPFISFG